MLGHHNYQIIQIIQDTDILFNGSLKISLVIVEIAVNFPFTSFPLELPSALLVDEAGGHCTEQDSCCQETDGGDDASHHRPRQSTLLHQLWRREDVCEGRRE